MSELVNIAGLDKGAVLKALHDGTRPLGLGRLHAIEYLPLEQAQEEFEQYKTNAEARKAILYVDYYHGRPLKVRLDQDKFDPTHYDRDAGEGAAARAIAALRDRVM